MTAAVADLGGERHVNVDSLAMKQLIAMRQSSHLDLWREGVPIVHQAGKDVLPQIGLQFLQHPLNGVPDCHARHVVLHAAIRW